jgi:hypothetical protein
MARPEIKLIFYHKLGKEGEARETSREYNRINGTRMHAEKADKSYWTQMNTARRSRNQKKSPPPSPPPSRGRACPVEYGRLLHRVKVGGMLFA